MRCPNCARLLLYCAMLNLLAGCGPSEPDAPPARPPAQLQLDIAADNLDELDLLDLRGCALQATVRKHHSTLGRAAKPSQRLLLALEYLHLAPACLARLRRSNNDALADRLAHAWHRRRAQLPALIFNATLASDEYAAFWLPAPAADASAPGLYPRVDRRATAAALAAINDQVRRWLGGTYRAQNRELELLLSEVAGGVGDALGPQHCHELMPPVADLEAQLDAVLPQRYRAWMQERSAQLARLACSKPEN
jgi:hypothetical protein